MSFLDSLKSAEQAILHTTANALHAQLANALSQQGIPVTADDHVNTLVSAAQSAGAKPGNAPTPADAALATFQTSMTALLLQYAQAHLPAKFQAAAVSAVKTVEDVLGGSSRAEVAADATKVVAAAVAAAAPAVAPAVAVAEPIVEAVVAAAVAPPAGQSASEAVSDVVAPAVDVVKDAAATAVATTVASAVANKVLGGLAGANPATFPAAGAGPLADQAPPVNNQGV